MAENGRSFPKIAESNWWKLRGLFKQRVPAVVTTTYLASALAMTEDSARGNIVTPFKKLGILDEEGKPTDLAFEWRDDSKYPTVCQRLLEGIYPREVRDLYASLESDPKALTSWFMNYCRCGEPAASMFAKFYRLLLKSDPSPPEEKRPQKQRASTSEKRPRIRTSRSGVVAAPGDSVPDGKENAPPSGKSQRYGSLPQLHINIQLHISPETTADQIDRIFESMAKHLKDFKV